MSVNRFYVVVFALQINLQRNPPKQLSLDNVVVSMLPEPCVQTGNCGLEGEIERLKSKKCALVAEVVRLRQL